MSQLLPHRIIELNQILSEANSKYYQGLNTGLSDVEFDKLLKELKSLETENPELIQGDSPTIKVGSDLNEGFSKAKHKIPMLSISNTYNPSELKEFLSHIAEQFEGQKIEWVAEMKIDGVSLALIYEEGKLIKAITRGDGKQGDEVTLNALAIQNIPHHINQTIRTEIRGETYMPHFQFNQLNELLISQGKPTLANPRNTTAGTIKMKDPQEVKSRGLHFFAFNIVEGMPSKQHSENLNWLIANKFAVAKHHISDDSDSIVNFCLEQQEERKNLNFDIDGMVIKVNSLDIQSQLGSTSKSPRWISAFKFEAEKALSQLLEIEFQVGRTGVITPVANLIPVSLCGTTVKRATLHNFSEIERLDLRLGDWVYIEKGGEIIPKITEVDFEKRPEGLTRFQEPTHCPICDSTLERLEGEIALRCLNLFCPAQVQRYLEHFVSRPALNIENIGPSLIEQLISSQLVKKATDLFKLKLEDLSNLERMAEKSALNVLKSLEEAKSRPAEDLLHAMGIRQVGRNAAKTLMEHFKSIEELAEATIDDLEKIPDIGFKTAQTIVDFFSDSNQIETLQEFIDLGLNTKATEKTGDTLLSGKTFVITGTLENMDRVEAAKLIEKNGGKVSSSISAKTTYLLAGSGGGSKLKKAQTLGVEVIDLDSFLMMIETK